jgi:PAS domain S-box-containing protein
MENQAQSASNSANGLDRIVVHATGEMAERIRRFPWETTSTGAITSWPETLICAVNMMLDVQFPTLLAWGPEMVLLYNDACLPLLAEKHPGALGQTAQDCWSEAWHILGPKLTQVLERGEKFYFENELIPILRHGSLTNVYWTYSYSPVRDAAGAVCGILVVSHDVTAKLTAERERDEIAASLKNVLESTTDGLVVMDRDGRYTYVNEQAARIVSLRPAEMIGKTQWELFPRISETEFGKQYDEAMKTGRPRHFDSFYPEPLNAWLENHCYPSEHGISVYFRDVTEKKETEKALRISESRFRKLFESDMMGIAIPDRFGAFRESNDALLRMTGYTRDDQEAGLVRWDIMTPPEYAELDRAHIQEAAEHGSCTPYEKEYIRKDGTRVPILCGYALLQDSEDEYIGFVLDLTAQKQSETAMKEREGRFRALAESLPQLIWMANTRGETTYCNHRVFEYFGLVASETDVPLWAERFHPEDVENTFAMWRKSIKLSEPYQVEYRLRRHDGAYRHFLARAVPVRNEAGGVERWIGSCTDVHDRKLAEEALRRSEKLATAGRLAASIAHEINNPLEAVTNSIYLALQDRSLSEDTRSYLTMADQELARVSHITTQTLRFHKQSSLASATDLCEVMRSVLSLFGPRLRAKQISVKDECNPKAVVKCFADEMRQVFANLVSNALDATRPGGVLRIRVRKTRSWGSNSREGIKVIVADTGSGIPRSVQEHMFEPFVSTKEATGIGLGLWVSEGIIRKHGGDIKVRSRLGESSHGTVMALFLPS